MIDWVMTKPKPIGFSILVAGLLGGILPTPTARAQLSVNNYHGLALPNAGEDVIGEFNPINLSNPGVASFSNADGSGMGTASLGSQTANPAVSATVSCCNTANPQSISWGATGNLLYAFEVTGTASATAVVDVYADGGVSGKAEPGMVGEAQALLNLTDVSGDNYLQGPLLTENVEVCNVQTTAYCFPTTQQSFPPLPDEYWQITVRVGDVILVHEQAGAGLQGVGNYSANFSAFVDPQILLDRSDPPSLSLLFSPGIQQLSGPPASSVPEPSTVSLLSVGAVLAAWRFLRKRPKPSNAFSARPA